MYRLILLSLFLYPCFCKSQVTGANKLPSILIYSTGEQYLHPFIENELRELENVEQDTVFFDEVHSLNTFINENEYQGTIRDVIETHKSFNQNYAVSYDSLEKKQRDKITSFLTGHNYFLHINTISLGEQIEFQFKLFKTNDSDTSLNKIKTPSNITTEYAGVEDFFINTSSVEYKIELKNAIKRLFPKSNHQPMARLKINNQFVKTLDTLYFPIGKNVLLDASFSGDYDTKTLEYLWRNVPITGKTIQSSNRVIFENQQSLSASTIQTVNLNKLGEYRLGFKVFDGINYSEEIILVIETKEQEHIKFRQGKNHAMSLLYNSVFQRRFYSSIKWSSEEFPITYSIQNNAPYTLNEKRNLLIVREPLSDEVFYSEEIIDPKIRVPFKHIEIGGTDFEEIIIKDTVIADVEFWHKKNTYYLYWISPDNLLSASNKIGNYVVNRHRFNLTYTPSPIHKVVTDELIPTYLVINDSVTEDLVFTRNSRTNLTHRLSFGAFFTKNIELGFSFPLQKISQPDNFENYINYKNLLSFRSIPSVELFSRFHFYIANFTSLHTGIRLNYYKGLNNDNVYNFGIPLGLRVTIPISGVQIILGFGGEYGWFFNPLLRKSYSTNMFLNLGINFG